jgi:hypothetical protein
MGTTERRIDDLLSADAARECVIRERWARDTGQWDVMEESYFPDTTIAVGWTSCSGAEFIEATRTLAGNPRGQGLHQLGPMQCRVNGSRAFVELPAQIVMPVELDGVDATTMVWERMCFRVERRATDWRVAEFRAVYLRDHAFPNVPGEQLKVDRDRLATCRPSYCFTQYWSNQAGWGDHPDRPGVDRPDLMDAVYRANHEWVDAAPDGTARAGAAGR